MEVHLRTYVLDLCVEADRWWKTVYSLVFSAAALISELALSSRTAL